MRNDYLLGMGFLRSGEMVINVQYYKYTKFQWISYFKMVNMVNCVLCKFHYNCLKNHMYKKPR